MTNDLVPVAWRDGPFSGAVHRAVRPEGVSIAEIVESITSLPPQFKTAGVVCINGEPIPRHLWRYVRPRVGKREVVVTLHLAPGNGKTLELVATIAVLVAAIAVSAGALGPAGLGLAGSYLAAGSTSAALAAGAVSVAGALAIGALSRPPVADNSGNSSLASVGGGTASLSANTLEKGSSVPRVIGTMQVFPVGICQPLVENVVNDQYSECVFALAGPHQLNNIKLDNVIYTTDPSIQLETREGWGSDLPLTVVTRYGRTDSPNVILTSVIPDPNSISNAPPVLYPADPRSNAQWQTITTHGNPDEIWINVEFPQGCAEPASNTPVALPFRVRMRPIGTSTWINLPEVHYSDQHTGTLRRSIRMRWQDTTATVLSQPALSPAQAAAESIQTVPTTNGWVYAITSVPTSILCNLPGGWTANSYFYKGSGDIYLAAVNSGGSTGVINTGLFGDRAEFYLNTVTFPKGPYEIQIMVGMNYGGGTALNPSNYKWNAGASNIFDFFSFITQVPGSAFTPNGILLFNPPTILSQVVLSTFSMVYNKPPCSTTGDFALIAVRVKNKSVSTLSVEASGYVKDWDGSGWNTWTTSNNPATHYRDITAGVLNSDPVRPDLIEDQNTNDPTDCLVGWRAACITNGYTVNAVLQTGSVSDGQAIAASCGYAGARQSETWGVTQDFDRSGLIPVQIFSPVNLGGFRFEKAFPRTPDGFRCTFIDADDNWTSKEIIVKNPLLEGAASVFEDQTYNGLVHTSDVQKRATFDFGNLNWRMTYYYGEADYENILCRRGDLVGVQHDSIDHSAGFARIKQVVRNGGNITGLVLSGSVDIPTDTAFSGGFFTGTYFAPSRFGVAIRLRDGTKMVKEISLTGDTTTEVEFVTPFADPGTSSLDVGCMLTAGKLGTEYHRMIVFLVQPKTDLQATITFVDEAPQLWPLTIGS